MSVEQTFFSVTINPVTQDVDAIIASARPNRLVSTTFFSPTSLQLNFGELAPGQSAGVLNDTHKPLKPPHK